MANFARVSADTLPIEEYLENTILHLAKQIKDGGNSNRNALDGYTLKGLQEKHDILQECLDKLKKQ